MRARAVVVLTRIAILAALPLAGRPLAAQEPDTSSAVVGRPVDRGRESIFGVSIGLPGYGSATDLRMMTVGFQWTRARPSRLGADVALGVMPLAFTAGLAGAMGRAGLALPLRTGPVGLLIPSAGVSGLIAGGPFGVGGLGGYYGGLSLAMLEEGGSGVRFGTTLHQLEDSGGLIWLVELGLVRGR